MILLLLACSGSSESTPVDNHDSAAISFEFPCDDPSRQVHVDITDRDPSTRTFAEGVVIDGVWVSALEGCEDISGNLAAMNWYSVSDVDAATAYSENYVEDLAALWKIWVPATLINFGFSPIWFRIPFVACTSMIWTCILSAMRGSADVQLELELLGQRAGRVGRASARACKDGAKPKR